MSPSPATLPPVPTTEGGGAGCAPIARTADGADLRDARLVRDAPALLDGVIGEARLLLNRREPNGRPVPPGVPRPSVGRLEEAALARPPEEGELETRAIAPKWAILRRASIEEDGPTRSDGVAVVEARRRALAWGAPRPLVDKRTTELRDVEVAGQARVDARLVGPAGRTPTPCATASVDPQTTAQPCVADVGRGPTATKKRPRVGDASLVLAASCACGLVVVETSALTTSKAALSTCTQGYDPVASGTRAESASAPAQSAA